MLTRWRVSCAALILSLLACGGKSVAEKIAEHDRVRVSWEQTTRFVGAEWLRLAVPDAYAARTLQRASEELRSDSEALTKEKLPSRELARLHQALSVVRARADSLARAVRARDRDAAIRMVKDSPPVNADSLLRQAGLQ
jgi:hypothetical protein